ncbi:hypothetical protein BKA70DRAFT_1262343 [Coprinopsis sp. MPI-PUGE-AT-0042]|nr:hypothetical protein BKA70DRAFT_1262343 [Coprinopsis sp. MPI-PUGE-AT-0042]
MSLSDIGRASEIVEQSVVYPTQYVVAVSLAILLYDYSLTFCKEVSWMWKGSNKVSAIPILFFIHRYFILLGVPVLIFQYFWNSTDPGRLSTCETLTKVHYGWIFVSQSIVATILILRTHALYGHNRWVLGVLLIFALGATGSAIWALVAAPTIAFQQTELPPMGCILPVSFASIKSYMPTIITAGCIEVLVFALTLYKSVQVIKKENSIILRILLRDGALFFGIVALSYIAILVSFYLFDDHSRGNLATLATSLYSTLISRLILNLRDPSLSSDTQFEATYARNQQNSDIMSSIEPHHEGASQTTMSQQSYYRMKRMSSGMV